MKKISIIILLTVSLSLSLVVTSFAFDSMKYGDRGDNVKEVQQILIDRGYLDDIADGSFGPMTRTAVYNYQLDHGLEANGIVDEATYNLLISQGTKNSGSEPGTENAGSGQGAENTGSGQGAENAGSGQGAENTGSGQGAENTRSEQGAENAGSGQGTENAGSGQDAENAGSGQGTDHTGSEQSTDNAGSDDAEPAEENTDVNTGEDQNVETGGSPDTEAEGSPAGETDEDTTGEAETSPAEYIGTPEPIYQGYPLDTVSIIDSGDYLVISDAGYCVQNGNLFYTYILHNYSDEFAYQYVNVHVSARDAYGNLLGTQTLPASVVYPGQDYACSRLGFSVAEMPAAVEFELSIQRRCRIKFDKLSNFKTVYVPLEISEISVRKEKSYESITGEAFNPNYYDIDDASVIIVFRNENGSIVGGWTTNIDNIRSGQIVPFEMRIPIDSTDLFEMYSTVW